MRVGICGLAGHGKDEAARALTDTHGVGFIRAALADPVRSDMIVLNPIVTEDGLRLEVAVEAHGWEYAKRAYPEVRRLLRTYSTDVVRERVHQDQWVTRLVDHFPDMMTNPAARYVVPDVRFPNEVKLLKFDILMHVVRPDGPDAGQHVSEQLITQLLKVAPRYTKSVIEIRNDSTVSELHRKVLAAVGPWL